MSLILLCVFRNNYIFRIICSINSVIFPPWETITKKVFRVFLFMGSGIIHLSHSPCKWDYTEEDKHSETAREFDLVMINDLY